MLDIMDSHANAMTELKRKLSRISDEILPKDRIAYIDYPAHFNIGDLLINMGAESYFRENNLNVISRYSIGDIGKYESISDSFDLGRHVDVLDKDISDGAVIVFHGGGNFGDIWPHHHKAREAILNRYKGVKTIVLPQSIHFDDMKKKDEAANIINDHGNVTLFVRDEQSAKFVLDSGIKGGMLPDMAHHLWGDVNAFPYAHTQGAGTLLQTRLDSEGSMAFPNGKAFDWDDVISPADRLAYTLFSIWRRLNPVQRGLPSYKVWYAIRDRVTRKGVENFQPYARVETDRLHGLILSALLSKPVHFDDRGNKYRKLNRYYQQWLSASPLITAA